MSSIFIKAVDETNENLVRNIQLKKSQEGYIESVDECLSDAKRYPQYRPVAIYEEEQLVGFAMYGCFGAHRHTWIDRIMIDKRFQGRGIGREALLTLIDKVSDEYQVDELYLSIVEENKTASHLYESIGFEYIHEKDPNGELIFKYNVT